MSPAPTPDDVLPSLEGWQGASWSELDGGLSNRTYRLDQEGRSAVLKIDAAPRRPPCNTRRQEAAVQTVAAGAGLANDVLYADSRIYLTDYVDGAVWSPATFDEEGSLERLARALRRLHALPLCGRAFDAAFAGRVYAARIRRDGAMVALCIRIIDAIEPARDVRLCHNDLVAENIISTPEIRFLDWEFACDNDPLFDLATVVEHHGLSRDQALSLLGACFGADGESRLPELESQCRLYRALLWLWLATRADTAAAELDRVATRLTTSCS